MATDQPLFAIGEEVRLSMGDVLMAHEEIAATDPLLRITAVNYDEEAHCCIYATEYYDVAKGSWQVSFPQSTEDNIYYEFELIPRH